jgi:hypothetical protein
LEPFGSGPDPGLAPREANSCASKSLILITRLNLIALAEYKGSQLKPDHDSPADAAGRFRTTRWSVVLLLAQIADELCEALMVAEGWILP